MLAFRNQLLEAQYLSDKFLVGELAMSRAFTLPATILEAYADDLMYYMGEFFGCRCIEITSGNREPSVFIGNKNHVQLAYVTFHYLNDFLSREMDIFLKKCHRNTKKKNRYMKAGWHCGNLVTEMIHDAFDDDYSLQYYSGEEDKALGDYVFARFGRYFDENEPLGGWYKPPVKKKRKKDFFLW